MYLAQVDAREADVESRFQVARGQGRHLVDDQLAGLYRLPRHPQHRLRAQRFEVRLIHAQQDFGSQPRRVFFLSRRAQRLRLHEMARAAEIRDQLRDGHADAHAIEDGGVVECARGDARAIERGGAGDAAVNRRPVRRSGLPDHLARGSGRCEARLHLWMAVDGALLGLTERQPLG